VARRPVAIRLISGSRSGERQQADRTAALITRCAPLRLTASALAVKSAVKNSAPRCFTRPPPSSSDSPANPALALPSTLTLFFTFRFTFTLTFTLTIHPSMSSLPTQFAAVTVVTKANVYFDGNVVSHTVLFADASKKTLGLIRPGSYYFGTGAAERMEIVAGECTVTQKDSTTTTTYRAGTFFDVPANSGFTIAVPSGLCEYICSFLP